jgi:hypothetical protein
LYAAGGAADLVGLGFLIVDNWSEARAVAAPLEYTVEIEVDLRYLMEDPEVQMAEERIRKVAAMLEALHARWREQMSTSVRKRTRGVWPALAGVALGAAGNIVSAIHRRLRHLLLWAAGRGAGERRKRHLRCRCPRLGSLGRPDRRRRRTGPDLLPHSGPL